MKEATEFVGLCYNVDNGPDMSAKKYKAWTKKTKGKLTTAPRLLLVPPTTEAFEQNVLRAHYQCAVWKSALQHDPPDLDGTDYGSQKNEIVETLQPFMVPENVTVISKRSLKNSCLQLSCY